MLAFSTTVAAAGPDLSATVPILNERFEQGLDRFDGRRGLWSTLPRRGQLMTNAAEAVFIDRGVLEPEADALLPPVHVLTEEGLSLRSVTLPQAVLPSLQRYMQDTGQGNRAAKVRYGVGEITTAHTWSQTYGYFEIEARIPRGKGRWPAFWLTFAGLGWPPEIDVFEAFGEGISARTPKDNLFTTAVLFDALDEDGASVHDVDIENPHEIAEGAPQKPSVKTRGEREIYTLGRNHNAATELGADIYAEFHTYAALWTPDTITFYFGKDRDSLQEIYRTTTPPDAHKPMFVIANDQMTARGGWWTPKPGSADATLDPENAFVVRQITLRALTPDLVLDMQTGARPYDPRDSVIHDTPGDDVIAPGDGFDMIRLSTGADRLNLRRGRDSKVIEGFGADDIVQLDGYPFSGTADVLSRLTQVGADVWLPSGADPGWPHTVIFRNSLVADFSPEQFDVRWSVPLDIWLADASRDSRPLTDDDGDGVLAPDVPGATMADRGKPVAMMGTDLTDRYILSHRDSTVTEPADGGVDSIMTWQHMVIPDHVELGIARGQGVQLTGGPGNDRLSAENARAGLHGSEGDDLFIISPDAENVTVTIGATPGHDRLRGFGPGHRLVLQQTLRDGRADWIISQHPEGTLVSFGPEQSLLIEDHTPQAAAAILGPT